MPFIKRLVGLCLFMAVWIPLVNWVTERMHQPALNVDDSKSGEGGAANHVVLPLNLKPLLCEHYQQAEAFDLLTQLNKPLVSDEGKFDISKEGAELLIKSVHLKSEKEPALFAQTSFKVTVPPPRDFTITGPLPFYRDRESLAVISRMQEGTAEGFHLRFRPEADSVLSLMPDVAPIALDAWQRHEEKELIAFESQPENAALIKSMLADDERAEAAISTRAALAGATRSSHGESSGCPETQNQNWQDGQSALSLGNVGF
jgi:hypothetical protein